MAASNKGDKKPKDFYVMVNKHQSITYLTPEEMHKWLNPALRPDGTPVKRNILSAFPKPEHGGCPFSAYKNNRTYEPYWPSDAVFILKNGVEVYNPKPTKVTVTAEVDQFEVEGYKPPKVATTKASKK